MQENAAEIHMLNDIPIMQGLELPTSGLVLQPTARVRVVNYDETM